jgi:hypothetical protein
MAACLWWNTVIFCVALTIRQNSDEQMEEEKMQEMHSLFIATSSQMW